MASKLRSIGLLAGILPFQTNSYDTIDKSSPTAQAFLNRKNDNETGWDRLRLMFSMDEFNNISPELNSVMQAGFLGLFSGTLYGGFIRSRSAYINFMENNQATAFKSHFEAKKKLQDSVTLSFGKGAFQWGWRIGLFSTSYVFFTTAISVYRGKSSIFEYIAGGAISGALYKFQLGPRGMTVGAVLGGVLGTFAGASSLLLLKLSGMTMEEARYWQYQWKEERDSTVHKVFKQYVEKDDSQLLKDHNEKIGYMEPVEVLKQIPDDKTSKENKVK